VLGEKVFSTVFSIRQRDEPAGSFVCESLLHPGQCVEIAVQKIPFLLPPGQAGSKCVEIAVQKIPFFSSYFFWEFFGYYFILLVVSNAFVHSL
jgi:hypothetical protein